MPLLERERERLLAELQEVSTSPSLIRSRSRPSQLEDENLKLQEEIASNVRQFNENEEKAESLLDVLDEVGALPPFCFSPSPGTQVLREWECLPTDEMSQWAREMIQQRSTSDKSMIF